MNSRLRLGLSITKDLCCGDQKILKLQSNLKPKLPRVQKLKNIQSWSSPTRKSYWKTFWNRLRIKFQLFRRSSISTQKIDLPKWKWQSSATANIMERKTSARTSSKMLDWVYGEATRSQWCQLISSFTCKSTFVLEFWEYKLSLIPYKSLKRLKQQTSMR